MVAFQDYRRVELRQGSCSVQTEILERCYIETKASRKSIDLNKKDGLLVLFFKFCNLNFEACLPGFLMYRRPPDVGFRILWFEF